MQECERGRVGGMKDGLKKARKGRTKEGRNQPINEKIDNK